MSPASLNTCKNTKNKTEQFGHETVSGRLENLAGLRKVILNKQFEEVLLAPSYNFVEMKNQLIELYRGQAYLYAEVKGPFFFFDAIKTLF